MEAYIMWTRLQKTGLEQLHLIENGDEIIADGFVLGIEQAKPFRFWYQIHLDKEWMVRECVLRIVEGQGQTLQLFTDGQGHWTDGKGIACSELNGCLYIDIACTPFTNTLPIRRLKLAPGEKADFPVAYISVPDLNVRLVRQRYTCVSQTFDSAVYRYEGLEGGKIFDITVDAQGLVMDYPGLWKRVDINKDKDDFSSLSELVLEGLMARGPHPHLTNKLQLFGQFIGSWDADWIGYQVDSVNGQKGKGEIHFAWILEGRAIQDVWIFPTREDLKYGLPMDEWGSTIRFYDPNIDAWRISWHGPVNHVVRTMVARPVEDEIWVEGPDMQGRPLRWIFSKITSASFCWSNFVSEDGGHSWRLQEELNAYRKP